MYTTITPKFSIDLTECFSINARCNHNVILNGEILQMSGKNIYKYCLKKNIKIPDHFEKQADIYITSDFTIDMSGCLCISGICNHNVTLNGDIRRMSGRDIYKYCFVNDIEIPDHFKQYDGCIKKVMLLYNL